MIRPAPAAVLALATALALGAAGPPAVALAPAPAPPAKQVDWLLDEAGRDARSLDLAALGSSSCLPGTLSARVVETSERIEITVVSDSTAEVCTEDYGEHPLSVRIAAPVRGRAIVGPRHVRRDPFGPVEPAARVRVPRVTGLARGDAVAVVRRHGLRPRVERVADLRGRPRVVGQAPASGRTLRARADVTLFLSR